MSVILFWKKLYGFGLSTSLALGNGPVELRKIHQIDLTTG